MNSPLRAAIAGSGSFLPGNRLTNDDLSRMVETTDEWIFERTGIRERRIVGTGQSTSTLAVQASLAACEDAGIGPEELDLIILATITPDYLFPASACVVQDAIGAKRAGAFDLEAACSGFIYGTSLAAGMIGSGAMKNVLVVGAESLSRMINYTDRTSCILFGDGAGAVVYQPAADGRGVIYSNLGADGSQGDAMIIPAGGSRDPATMQSVVAGQHLATVDGRRVFRFATEKFVELIHEAMSACELTMDDVAMIVPHQVNQRIIDAALKRLEWPAEKCFVNIENIGNTSAASIPIALDAARRSGAVSSGDTVIFVAFGAGLTWGASVVKM
jgi:3-oxoacyl-[acyl-carrier-protein] synthase-3